MTVMSYARSLAYCETEIHHLPNGLCLETAICITFEEEDGVHVPYW